MAKNMYEDHQLFPAHAGMNRGWGPDSAGWVSVPRTRGDEPSFLGAMMAAASCSPHTRG